MDVKAYLLFSLGGYSKQAGDKGDLILAVSLPHPSDLSFPDHVHDLVSLQRSPCHFHGKEAHPRLGQSFDQAVILLDQVIQVFDQVSRSTCSGRVPAALRAAMALG
jgi:hypothetical protein